MTEIKYHIEPQEDVPLTIDTIDTVVCEKFGISKEDLYSNSRKGQLPLARKICWDIIRNERVLKTWTSIAKHYGKGRHSTIFTAVKVFNGYLESDKKLVSLYRSIKLELKN